MKTYGLKRLVDPINKKIEESGIDGLEFQSICTSVTVDEDSDEIPENPRCIYLEMVLKHNDKLYREVENITGIETEDDEHMKEMLIDVISRFFDSIKKRIKTT